MDLINLKFYEFERMLFTARSIGKFNQQNSQLLLLLHRIKNDDPGASIEWVLACDFRGCFPFPLFHNYNSATDAILREKLPQLYSPYPIVLYPEFAGRKDHLGHTVDVDIAQIEQLWSLCRPGK